MFLDLPSGQIRRCRPSRRPLLRGLTFRFRDAGCCGLIGGLGTLPGFWIVSLEAADFMWQGASLSIPSLAYSSPSSSQTSEAPPSLEEAPATLVPLGLDHPLPRERLWSFEFAVAVISDNTPGDYLGGNLKRLEGPGGGWTYNFTVARRIHEFDWQIGSAHLRPQIDWAGMLTLVDENTGRVIPDLNLGVVLRWQDFPWNRFVRTTLAAGVGMSYSFQVWTGDYQRHPGEDRSRLKFWMPIEFTIAIPRWREHQLVAFIDHQSGGTLFDRGGMDAFGFGYRFEF